MLLDLVDDCCNKAIESQSKGIRHLLYFRHLHLFCGFFAIINDVFGKNDGKNLSDELSENEKRVLLELINNPSIPYDTLVVELGISRRTVSRVFVSLVEKGYIERVGTNKKGYWKIIR